MDYLIIIFICVCSFIHNELEVAMVGPKLDLTYEYEVCYILCSLCCKNVVWSTPCVLYWYIVHVYDYKYSVQCPNTHTHTCTQHLGDSTTVLQDIASGKHLFSKVREISTMAMMCSDYAKIINFQATCTVLSRIIHNYCQCVKTKLLVIMISLPELYSIGGVHVVCCPLFQ